MNKIIFLIAFVCFSSGIGFAEGTTNQSPFQKIQGFFGADTQPKSFVLQEGTMVQGEVKIKWEKSTLYYQVIYKKIPNDLLNALKNDNVTTDGVAKLIFLDKDNFKIYEIELWKLEATEEDGGVSWRGQDDNTNADIYKRITSMKVAISQ